MQTMYDILGIIGNQIPANEQKAAFQASTGGRNWGLAPQGGLDLSSFGKKKAPGTPGASVATMAGGPEDMSSIGPLIAAMS